MQPSVIALYLWAAGVVAACVSAGMFWRARLELQRTHQARQTAVAAAVHELRASILCISGYSALLLRRCAKEREAVQAIAREADRLERLTQDLFDQSILSDRLLDLDPGPCDLAAILRDEVGFYRSLSGRSIALSLPPGPIVGCWDELRITQVIRNLLGNAVKYAAEGAPITVLARIDDDAVEVSVRNRSLCVSPEDLPRLFLPYERLESHQAQPGCGLGLAISQAIVSQHGGAMGASALGEVVRFWFRLPPRPGQSDAPPAPPAELRIAGGQA